MGRTATQAEKTNRPVHSLFSELADLQGGREMRVQWTGFPLLFGYVVMVGVASFLEKFSMKQLNPYQINFLMAITAAHAAGNVLIAQSSTG